MKILVIGAGRMGYGAVYDLIYNSPQIESVTVVDKNLAALETIRNGIVSGKLNFATLDIENVIETVKLMKQHDSAISCVNYWHNYSLSLCAVEANCNFCDLGGNNTVVDRQLSLDEAAKENEINIIPDCGLAPGMVSILAMHGAKKFDEIEEIHIRVGGLPQNPKPPLDYQLVFSVEGLINEYIEKARVIRNGEITEVDSMTELESLEFDNFPALEAFQTSGGTSTLPDTFHGDIKELDYKTIRYAGHCEKFKAMIELGLCSCEPVFNDSSNITARKFFGKLLEENLPHDEPDYVLIRLDFKGKLNGESKTLHYDIVDKHDETANLSAMMRTTAFPASIIAQMSAAGEVARRGAVPQEIAIDTEKFVEELDRRNIKIKISEG